MKVWITQYALTDGIQEMEAEVCEAISKDMIAVRKEGSINAMHFHKPYWHESKEEAIVKANEIKEKKIKSLRKSIEKLEKLEF